MANPKDAAKSLTRRILFAAERFGELELANHAAAGAYSFLLSATPAALLVLGLASLALGKTAWAYDGVASIASQALGPLDAEGLAAAFFERPLGGFAALVGIVGLIWAARLFVVTIQRGIRVIWALSGKNAPVKENLLSFALELLGLVSAVAILAGGQIANAFADLIEPGAGALAAGLVRAFAGSAPAAALFAFVYGSYRFVPSTRPSRKISLLASALCVASFLAFAGLFGTFMDSARYTLLYGIFGRLIVLLVNVYTFFSLYYFFAELAYVEQNYDALLFARFRKTSMAGSPARLEKALFMEPARLLAAYGRELDEGETLFVAGDRGREAYYIHRGRIGIYIPSAAGERTVGSLGKGEVLGEMAHILDEPRTATARATEKSLVIALPPDMFDLFLRSDSEATRHLAAALAERLRAANARASDLPQP